MTTGINQEAGQNAPAVQTRPQTSQSERFTNMVIKEFSTNSGSAIALTEFQKRLVSNYFLVIDKNLKKAELARLEKSEQYRDPVALVWENVNMQQLAIDVVAAARVGLDPAQPNHINCIPYKNKHTQKYDLTFILGYRGAELKTKKYGLDKPDDIIVELVFETDKFVQIKKDSQHRIEGYIFEVTQNFNRGEIVGGFYYHSYFEHPEKNRLRVFSKADIDKRKPAYASAEFWGGEKDVWEKRDGKNVKIGKEKVDGWYEEMAYKTICRAAYNAITIDSQLIDDDYMKLLSNEHEALPPRQEEANSKTLSIDDIQTVEEINDTHAPETANATALEAQPKQEQIPGFGSAERTNKRKPNF